MSRIAFSALHVARRLPNLQLVIYPQHGLDEADGQETDNGADGEPEEGQRGN